MYFRIDSFTYAGIRNYDTVSKMGGPFFMHRIKGNQLIYNLRASSLQWDTATKKWKLHNVIERTINGLNEKLKKESVLSLDFNFKPTDLTQDEYAKDKLNTIELHKYIARLKYVAGRRIQEICHTIFCVVTYINWSNSSKQKSTWWQRCSFSHWVCCRCYFYFDGQVFNHICH
jgi:hypothetical protein